MTDAVRWIQDKLWVDRLETTIEAHTLPTAQVRENCTIPGTSVRTAWLCRDKPSMKEALRAAGVPTAASTGGRHRRAGPAPSPTRGLPADPQAAQRRRRPGHDPGRQQRRARRPPSACLRRPGRRRRSRSRSSSRATRASTTRCRSTAQPAARLRLALLPQRARRDAHPVDLARSSSRPTGSTRWPTTSSCARWANGSTRRSGIGTSATHMEWFFGPKGLQLLRDRLPSAGCRRLGPLLRRATTSTSTASGRTRSCTATSAARAVATVRQRASSRCGPSATDRSPATPVSTRSQGRYGEWVIDAHLPDAGHADAAGGRRLHGQRLRPDAPPRLRRAARHARRRRPDRARARRVSAAESSACWAHSAGRRWQVARTWMPTPRWPCTITAGWQEREADDAELRQAARRPRRQPRPVRALAGRPRAGPGVRAGRARAPAAARRAADALPRAARPCAQAMYAVARRRRRPRCATGGLADAMAVVRVARRRHLRRVGAAAASSTQPGAAGAAGRSPNTGRGARRCSSDAAGLVVAGGHVGVLADALHLFHVAASLARRRWSPGRPGRWR